MKGKDIVPSGDDSEVPDSFITGKPLVPVKKERKKPARVAKKGVSRRLHSGEVAISNAIGGSKFMLKKWPSLFNKEKFRGSLVHTPGVQTFVKDDTPDSRTEKPLEAKKQHGYDKLIYGDPNLTKLDVKQLLRSSRCLFRFSKKHVNRAKLKSAHPPAPYYPKDFAHPEDHERILKEALAPYMDAFIVWTMGPNNKNITHICVRKIRDIPLTAFRLYSDKHSRNTIYMVSNHLDFWGVNEVRDVIPGYPSTTEQMLSDIFYGEFHG
jgi:hypothetical protein